MCNHSYKALQGVGHLWKERLPYLVRFFKHTYKVLTFVVSVFLPGSLRIGFLQRYPTTLYHSLEYPFPAPPHPTSITLVKLCLSLCNYIRHPTTFRLPYSICLLWLVTMRLIVENYFNFYTHSLTALAVVLRPGKNRITRDFFWIHIFAAFGNSRGSGGVFSFSNYARKHTAPTLPYLEKNNFSSPPQFEHPAELPLKQ